jgi:transposase
MGQNFLACDREQGYLMPPSLRDWLAGDQLAWCVLDSVAELDLAAFYADYRADGHGRAAFDPAMMVALVVYAYAIGERSARGIERRCHLDVAFRVITANQTPDHATIARFRVRHQDALAGLFGQVLALCARAGLVSVGVIAVDGTKLAGNASGLANRTYEQIAAEILAEADAVDRAEDERFGALRGDELPAELADPASRKARLRAAKAQLEAEAQAERDEYAANAAQRAEHLALTGRNLPGRPLGPRKFPELPDGRVNLTDCESRPVKTPRGFIQGYNAQAVATAGQIIIAADVTIGSPDQGLLEPMIRTAITELKAAGINDKIGVVLADAGYWKKEQIETLFGEGIAALVPPDGHARGSDPNPRRRGELYDFMRRVLKTEHGAGLYRQRGQTIEAIFGQTKHNRRIDRFQRRGRPACQAEWKLITATHNLLKLWRHNTTAPMTA